MLQLYQMPISHYCEKIRWALDFKRLDYQLRNLLPGLHIKKAKKLAPRSSLPILVHKGKAIQGSSEIINYLEEVFPDHPLTPQNPELKQEALRWEQFADQEIGGHVRLICYHILLDYPDIVSPFFTHQGPWYGKFLIRRIYPRLQKTMREFMNINEQSFQESLDHLRQAVAAVNAHLDGRDYFTGEQFSRADLAHAALLAPLAMPAGYGLDWPPQVPDRLQQVMDEIKPQISWVDSLYANYRRAAD